MATLSVCMIVKNEQKLIRQAISSIQPLADEIVVVDTGSTDKTKKIAKEFTQNVYDFKWIDDFSAAYNFAQSKASKQFCIRWDADFSIDSLNLKKLKAAKKANFGGANLVSLNWVAEKTATNRILTIRDFIFRRTDFHAQFPVHARIIPNNGIKIKRTSYPDIFINHHKEQTDTMQRYNQTASILEKTILQYPNEPYLLLHKLDGELFFGFADKAEKTATQLLAMDLPDDEKARILSKKIQALLLMKKTKQAIKLLDTHPELSKHPVLELLRADLTSLTDTSKAQSLYQDFISKQYTQKDIGPGYSEYRYIAHPILMLVRVCLANGDTHAAKKNAQKLQNKTISRLLSPQEQEMINSLYSHR